MKNVYFANWWDIHNGRLSKNYSQLSLGQTEYYASGRALYGDWGRIGNVVLDEELNAFTQFNFENPISHKSDAFYYKKEDDILFNDENTCDFIEKRKELISAFIYFRNNVERKASNLKRKHKSDMETFIEAVDCGNKSHKVLRKKCHFTPASIQYLADKQSDLLNERIVADLTMLSSPINSGGRIKVVNFKSNTYVIFCDGLNMSKLTVCKLNSIANILENTEINRYEIGSENETIFQVEAVANGEYINVLVRFIESVCLLKVFETQDGLKISKSGNINSMDQFMSCKLGNNYTREFVGTFSDKMELYDSQINRSIWCKSTVCYSSVIDKWNEIQSTNFPKVWIYTNRYNSTVYDTRINPFSSGLELSNTKLDSFSKSESFYHATNLFQDNYFYLFTALSAFLVDIRSPLIAVSQWTVPSMSPCTHSSIDLLSHTDRINFTLSSELGANHLVFQQHIDNFSKSTAIASKLSPIGRPIMSLGIASYFNRSTDELSVLTLDQLGNIIGNQYKLTSDLYNHCSMEKDHLNCFDVKNRFQFMENENSDEDIDMITCKLLTKTNQQIGHMERFLGLPSTVKKE